MRRLVVRLSLLLVPMALAGAALFSARQPAAGQDGETKKAYFRYLGAGRLTRAVAVISNGTGDGTATLQMDAYGEFGAAAAGRLLYDPIGPIPQGSTTFYSSVWFSGAGNAGVGGRGVFFGETSLPAIAFTSTSPTRATSEWDFGGMHIQLVQEIGPATGQGSVIRQTYTLTNNTNAPTSFDLIRHIDGDLLFDGTLQDGGGVGQSGQLLYEFDNTDDPTNPTTFVGIDLAGNANLGYRIAPFPFDDDILANGRAVLNNTITGPGGINIDTNGDGITDSAFDVTLSLGQTFNADVGQSVTFVTHTLLGQGAPSDVTTSPRALVATPLSSTSIRLDWIDTTATETGFEVERKDGPPGSPAPYATVGTSPANTPTFTDTGLTPSTTYTYRVRATFATGVSAYSNEASATTFGPPTAPGLLTARTVSPTAIELTWLDRSTDETGFELERKRGGPFDPDPFRLIRTLAANVTRHRDAGLAPNTTYTYRVRAINPNGASPYSNLATARTFGPPAAPTALQAEVSGPTTVRLTWQDNSDNEDGFRIERKAGAQLFALLATTARNVSRFEDAAVAPGTTYAYRIRAFNAFGNSAYSNLALVTAGPPSAPASLAVQAPDSRRVVLEWRDLSRNESGFRIQRRVGPATGDGSFSTIALVGADTTTYADTSVAVNTTYTYRVRAFNAAGDSPPTGDVDVTTLAPPGNVSARAAGASEIEVTWQDRSLGESGFRIERKSGPPSSTEPFTEVGVVGPGVERFRNVRLSVGAIFTYRVRAYAPRSTSDYSNEAAARTAGPIGPAGLVAVVISRTTVRLNWTDASADESGFRIERKTGDAAAPAPFLEIASTGPNVTTFDDRDVTEGTTYTYRVRAFNPIGFSPYSNAATVTVGPPLEAPGDLRAFPLSGREIQLQWSDNTDNERGFRIERKTGATGTFREIRVTATGETRYRDAGLTPNTTYVYRVRAFNGLGYSPYSNEASATTFPVPAAPTDLRAAFVSPRQVRLSWQDNSFNESGFQIERRVLSGGAASEFRKIAVVGRDVTLYVDGAVLPGVTYSYRVRAFNEDGASPYSNEAVVTIGSSP